VRGGAARNKTSQQNSLPAAKANGFTGMSATQGNRLDEQMELEIIQVDSVQPQRRKVCSVSSRPYADAIATLCRPSVVCL